MPVNDWNEDRELAEKETALEHALPRRRRARVALDAFLARHGIALALLVAVFAISFAVALLVLFIGWLAS